MMEQKCCGNCGHWLRKYSNVCDLTSVVNGEVKHTPYLSSKTYPTSWGKCDLGHPYGAEPMNTHDECPDCGRWEEIDVYRKNDRYEVFETSLIVEEKGDKHV